MLQPLVSLVEVGPLCSLVQSELLTFSVAPNGDHCDHLYVRVLARENSPILPKLETFRGSNGLQLRGGDERAMGADPPAIDYGQRWLKQQIHVTICHPTLAGVGAPECITISGLTHSHVNEQQQFAHVYAFRAPLIQGRHPLPRWAKLLQTRGI